MYWSDGAHSNVALNRNLAFILLRLTGWDYEIINGTKSYDTEFVAAFITRCENGEEFLCDPEIVDSMLESAWESLTDSLKWPTAHDECKDYFFRYGTADYLWHPTHCAICGDPLFCKGKRQTHLYEELSQKQCRELGLYHGGMCWHVYKCRRCGHTKAYDSSD